MNIWMIGIEINYSSYDELKLRHVVAQGWSDLGDLSNLNNNNIDQQISVLYQQNYPQPNRNKNVCRILRCLLLEMKPDDLVLGFEGTVLRGICQLPKHFQYCYDNQYEYAHILHPVDWLDWNEFSVFMPPNSNQPCAGGQGPPGISQMRQQVDILTSAWQKYMNKYKGKIMSQKYMNRMINTGLHQMIFYGPPGTSKTHDATITAQEIADENRITTIQFHPAYTYEDFVRGIRVRTETDKDNPSYRTENGIIIRLAVEAFKEWEKRGFPNPKDDNFTGCSKWVLIIDEINRAHLAAVLGELIYGLEYRPCSKKEINKYKVQLPYSIENIGSDGFSELEKDEIVIPPNLFIIGTMNTADRSIGHLDYAVRRRFIVEPKLPDKIQIENQTISDQIKDQSKKYFAELENFFNSFIAKGFHKDDLMPGHTYFLGDSKEVLANKLAYQVYPLLREYVKDGILVKKSVPDETLWNTSPFNDDVKLDNVYEYVLSSRN